MAVRRTERTTTRETKMTSRKGEATDAPEKKGGLTMADGIAIVTAVIMIAAILVTDYHMGHDLNAGMFFKPH